MNTGRKIKALFGSVLAVFVYLTLPALPRGAVVRLARGLGAVAYRVRRRGREVALANLDLVYGETLSRAEKEDLARDTFRHFTLIILDFFWFSWFTKARLREWVSYDPSFDHYVNTAPVVAVTAHLGNWEVLGLSVALRGMPTVSIAAVLESPFIDFYVLRLRRRTGQRIVEQDGAMRALLRELKNGGRTAILMDQNTRLEDGGIFVNLFGLPVPTSKTAESLAAHTGAAAVFTYCMVDAAGRYTAYAEPPVRPGTMADGEMTQVLSGLLEKTIRKYPSQWLWLYKRWKFIPDGAPAEKYPFYAQRQLAKGRVSKA